MVGVPPIMWLGCREVSLGAPSACLGECWLDAAWHRASAARSIWLATQHHGLRNAALRSRRMLLRAPKSGHTKNNVLLCCIPTTRPVLVSRAAQTKRTSCAHAVRYGVNRDYRMLVIQLPKSRCTGF